jgi:hypothetical protein
MRYLKVHLTDKEVIVDEYNQKLLDDFAFATKELHNHGAETSQKPAHRYEILYGEAYQRLVTAGLKPQIRTKYRPK